MTNVPEVTVDQSYEAVVPFGPFSKRYGGKYIIATVGDRKILWAKNASASEHEDLVTSLEKTCGHTIRCLGGGMLYFSKKNKKIYIWDYSVKHGSDNKKETAEMLKKKFPGCKIVIDEPGNVSFRR